MNRDEMKVESSVPVQGRVSIVTLAELDMYWVACGIDIRSMSQLLSWSVDMLREVLNANDMLPVEIDTVAAAHRHLEERRLYQPGLKRRSLKKISNAVSMENLRFEGVDPQSYADRQYNTVHNINSVVPLKTRGIRPDVVEGTKILEKAIADAKKEGVEDKEKAVEAAKESGQLVDHPGDDRARKLTEEELNQKAIELEEKDRETLKELNKEVDVEDLKGGVV